MNKLKMIRNIIFVIVIIETIMLFGMITKKIIKLENKLNDIEIKVVELEKGVK